MSRGRGVLTLPNLVTASRLACVPVFVVLLAGLDRPVAAALLLAAAGATDWVDGYLARRLHQESELGKILDPTADRLLFLVAVFALLVDGSVPMWFGVMALVRELAVAGAALALGALGARRIDVSWLGKSSTFALMVTFPLFLLATTDVPASAVAGVLAWVFGVPGLALHYYAAWRYLPAARRALIEGRSGARRATPIR